MCTSYAIRQDRKSATADSLCLLMLQAAAAPKVARQADGSQTSAAALLAAAAKLRAADGGAAAQAVHEQQQQGSNGHAPTDGGWQRALRASMQAAQAAYYKAALRQHLLALGAQKKARAVSLTRPLLACMT